MIRTFWVALVALLETVRYGTPILLRSWRGGALDDLCRRNPRLWARKILWAAGVEVEIEGVEHLVGGDEGRVLVANHQSWFDIFALVAHLPVDYRFVAKKELEGVPIFGPCWQACGHISIDRGDLQRAIGSLERAAAVVRRARPTLIMFPEGTRSETGALRGFKKGAFVLAIQVGAPVVPAAIVGTREIMPKGSWRVRPGRVRVRIGAPISVEDLVHDDRDRLARCARGAVLRLMEGGDLEGPWDPGPSGPAATSRGDRRGAGPGASSPGAPEQDGG